MSARIAATTSGLAASSAGLMAALKKRVMRRAVSTLTDWLNALPPALANSRPGLLSLRGGIGYLRGNYGEALSLLNQAEANYPDHGENGRLPP